jgi:hypothetical protein
LKTDSNKVIKILFAILAVALVVYFFYTNEDEKKFQWVENYRSPSSQPYGTLFIQKLLSTYRPNTKFIVNDKTPLSKFLDSASISVKTDYVFIGNELYLDSADTDALLTFIASGNDAFIASVNLPFNVIDPIYINECGRQIFLVKEDTLKVTFNFYNKALKSEKGYSYRYRFGKTDIPYFWNTLNPEIFCDSTKSITPLGYIAPDKVNFFRMPYGQGNLYVHSNPIAFTNYFLTKRDKAEYASSVFSHLNGKAIIWDEFSKSEFLQKNNAPDVSPITYVLQQESLRYAWWLMLLSAVLYTIFTAKRKQRVIPVIEPKANTSLEYVNMISALHFQNANHHDIARKKMKYFFYFIRAKYNMHIQSLTEIQVKRLSEKSKVQTETLRLIATEFDHIEQKSYYNEPRLIDLQNALETFYKNCK